MAKLSRFQAELVGCDVPRSAAELRELGITRSMTSGPRWRRTSRGFYAPARTDEHAVTAAQRILEAAPLTGGSGAIGGWGAAYVHGVDCLDGRDAYTMLELPLLVYQGNHSGRDRRAGVTYSRERLQAAEVTERAGLRITALARTGFDGARLAQNAAEAVAFLDAVAASDSGILPVLRRLVTLRRGWKGVGQARLAVSLADPSARSTWESRLRVCYVVEARLPRPLVNVPIFDHAGKLLGIPDLLDDEAGYVVEFDGQQHRLRRQHRDDNVREEVFEAANLTVARVDSLDLRHHRQDLGRRLGDGWRRGMRRDRRYDGWTTEAPPWWLRGA